MSKALSRLKILCEYPAKLIKLPKTSQVGWKFLIAIYALISCVSTTSKTCPRVVKICNRGGNKNMGHPGRWFLTALQLCALAFKVLKPPSYAGYFHLEFCGGLMEKKYLLDLVNTIRFKCKPLWTMLNYVHQFFKIRVVFVTL